MHLPEMASEYTVEHFCDPDKAVRARKVTQARHPASVRFFFRIGSLFSPKRAKLRFPDMDTDLFFLIRLVERAL